MAYVKYTGKIHLLGDSVPGEDKQFEGKLYAISCPAFGADIGFVLREKKHYISEMEPREGDILNFYFRKDISPKFGKVWLLEGYGGRDHATRWCEGRRILIHRGNKPSGSANCWLIGKVTDTTFKRSNSAYEPTVVDSVATLNAIYDDRPEQIHFALEFVDETK